MCGGQRGVSGSRVESLAMQIDVPIHLGGLFKESGVLCALWVSHFLFFLPLFFLFNAADRYVATGDSSGLLKVWPLDFKEHLMQAQHDCGVAAIAVSQDDLKLAVSTVRGTLGKNSAKNHLQTTS